MEFRKRHLNALYFTVTMLSSLLYGRALISPLTSEQHAVYRTASDAKYVPRGGRVSSLFYLSEVIILRISMTLH